MQSRWERRKILIWGKTRPELSKTYREIVCTGGVFEHTRRLVRLYPIPQRYMNDEELFAKYQWVEADVMPSPRDYRPESFKVREGSIRVLEKVPPGRGNWDERAEWIMQPENVFQSVEALQERQREDRTSLGLVQPSEIIDILAVRVSGDEKRLFWERYKQAVAQLELPLDEVTGREIKPLRPPDYRFKIRFRCDDERCQGEHEFSVLDWEIDALYFYGLQRYASPVTAKEKVLGKLRNQVCAPDKDLFFFLGNIFSQPHVFTIVGLWWPKRKNQLGLF